MKKNRLFHLAFLLVAVLLAQDSRAQNGVELGDAFEQMVTSALTSELANPDSVALVALYNATDGPNWRDKTNWLSDRPLGEWEGVSTENVGPVYELRLERNRLSGEIPSELGNLANLRYLVLNQNRLSGEIPSELGNLASLRYLELDQNRLSGEIPAELGNLTHLERLVLSDNQLTGTIPKELGNLTHLTHLELDDNQLSTLPDGLFAGLSSLAVLRLDGNSVDPLPLAVSLEQVGADQVQAVAPIGAPFEIVLPISVTNGRLSGGATTLTIPAGSVASAPLTVVRTPGTTAAVTVDIGPLPGLPTDHVGYALVKASDLPLEVLSSTVGTVGDRGDQQPEQPQQPEVPGGEGDTPTPTLCDRTPQVRDAIVAAVPSVSDCNDVTEAQLATGITSLFLNGQSITTLKADDFAGLTRLVELRLYDNQLSTLPANLFDGLSSLTTLYLNGNQLSLLPKGLFDGLSSLATLYLYGNAVDPLPLAVSLEQVGADQVQAVAPIGAPFEIVLPISVTNGRLSSGATTLTIPAGSVASASLTVVRTPGTAAAVTVDMGPLPRRPANHVGYALVKSSDRPLEISSTLANTAPVFPDGASTTRTIAEHTTAGVNIGTALAATDADHDALTYTLGGTDAAAFAMESTTGQLKTKAALDYETKSAYSVVVTVSDGTLTDTIIVTITVTDLEEVGESIVQQPEQPAAVDRTTFESSTPAGYTQVTLSKTGSAWGIPTKFTNDSKLGKVAFMVLGKLKGCSFANAEAARPSKVYIKTQNLGSQSNYVSETVCGTTTRSYSSRAGSRITRLRFFDESSPSNIKEAVYNAATGQIEISGEPPPPYARNPAFDFNTLEAAGNTSPVGIWSDGTTMWVVDGWFNATSGRTKIYAYDLATKARVPIKEFNTLYDAENDHPVGIWSDGTTMWVADDGVGDPEKIYAYDLATKERVPTKDFNTLYDAGNYRPKGLWSDGITMWVADVGDDKIYAYDLATKERVPTKDFNTLDDAGNTYPHGIWSDGTTLWVTNYRGENRDPDKIYAYDLATKERIRTREFNTLGADGIYNPTGIWSDGTIMWVADSTDGWGTDKIYAYNMPANGDTPDADAPLANTTPVFTDGAITTRTIAENTTAGVVVGTAIAATDADHDALTYTLRGTDAAAFNIESTTGQLQTKAALDYETKSVYMVTVTVSDGTLTDTIIVTINVTDLEEVGESIVQQPEQSPPYTRDRAKEFDTLQAAGNNRPGGLWSDGTTLWVTDLSDDKIYAYHMRAKARDPNNDFNTLQTAGNNAAGGLWSDGTTLWVTDLVDAKLYAYNLSTKRDHNNDFNTLRAARNNRPTGLWSDGTTLWVADSRNGKIYAYNLSTKAHDPANDFNTLRAARNNRPGGLWSDGTTLWVADSRNGKIYAYNLSTKARDPDKDFNTLRAAGNVYPYGLWSDGTTLWVADLADDRIYAYRMPSQPAAKAQALIGLPEKTQLQQNTPNPFNSETVLSYFLLEPGPARLEVFSMIGQRVAILRQGHQQAGYHRLRWNGRDHGGRPLASGIYLYRLVTDEGILTRKLVLLR